MKFTLKDYQQADYLVLATASGLVKKTRLTEYDSPRSGGVIAIRPDGQSPFIAEEQVIAGNVATADGTKALIDAGADAVEAQA